MVVDKEKLGPFHSFRILDEIDPKVQWLLTDIVNVRDLLLLLEKHIYVRYDILLT